MPDALSRLIRAEQWWSFKLIPPLAIAYATCALSGTTVGARWPALLLLLVALASGAMGVSIVNDLTDREDDRRAGKANRMAGPGARLGYPALGLAAIAGAAVLWGWRDSPTTLALYMGAWVAFLLYSMAPIRLKTRGFWGVAADAAGAHMFPALLAASAVAAHGAHWPWFATVALWSWTYGVRGIVWHQLADREGDARAGTDTFVTRTSGTFATRMVTQILFPIELSALLLLLLQIHSLSAWAGLACYGTVVVAKIYLFHATPSIVASPPRYFILLQDFYLIFLPYTLLADAISRSLTDGCVLVAHLIIFAPVTAGFAVDLGRLVFRALKAIGDGALPILIETTIGLNNAPDRRGDSR